MYVTVIAVKQIKAEGIWILHRVDFYSIILLKTISITVLLYGIFAEKSTGGNPAKSTQNYTKGLSCMYICWFSKAFDFVVRDYPWSKLLLVGVEWMVQCWIFWCQCMSMSRQKYIWIGRNHISLTLNWVYHRDNVCHRSILPCTSMILKMSWAVLIPD